MPHTDNQDTSLLQALSYVPRQNTSHVVRKCFPLQERISVINIFATHRAHGKMFPFNPLSANHDCSRRCSQIFFHCFSEKIRLDVSSESSARRQRIHMKNQALFSSKDKSKKLKCRLLQFLFGALRVINKSMWHGHKIWKLTFTCI